MSEAFWDHLLDKLPSIIIACASLVGAIGAVISAVATLRGNRANRKQLSEALAETTRQTIETGGGVKETVVQKSNEVQGRVEEVHRIVNGGPNGAQGQRDQRDALENAAQAQERLAQQGERAAQAEERRAQTEERNDQSDKCPRP